VLTMRCESPGREPGLGERWFHYLNLADAYS
jgi:hypothetical protein